MFIRTRKAKQKLKGTTYKPGDILPVLTASDLLAAGRHHILIEQVRSISGLPDDYFDSLYFTAIQNFAEYVQVLPLLAHAPLSSLLNHSIARAIIALKNFVLEQGKQVDPLLNYAVFTAALLIDIDKLVINQKIVIVDENGLFVDDWRPFEGALVGRGSYYKIYPIAPIYQRLQQTIKPLLARQVLPELGFQWIVSDPIVFAEWLDALRDDDSQGGRVGRALAFIKLDDVINLEDSLQPIEVDPLHSKDTELGEAFFNWLKNAIENNDIKVNTADAAVHIVNEGVFLERKLFKQFADICNAPVHMNAVFTQFGNLFGIAKKGGYDYAFDQYFSEYPEARASNQGAAFASPLAHRQRSLREGMVLADPSVVFVNARIPASTPLLKAMQPDTEKRNFPVTAKKQTTVKSLTKK